MVDFDRLDALIRRQGKKKSHLCALAGKGRGYISDAKNGNGTISDEALEIFARELGTTVAYLRGQTDDLGQKEAPGTEAGREISDDELMFGLWGDSDDVDEDDLADVKRYAQFVRERKKDRRK